jgi:hypothetical protein
MKDRNTLTKSLHTITVVSRVAAHIAATKPSAQTRTLVRDALELIGQGTHWDTSEDETMLRCITATNKLLGRK